jgi:hypothetical protein
MTRYAHPSLGSSTDRDLSRLICRDCSTRTHAVVIPADEQADHDAWHAAEDSDRPGVWVSGQWVAKPGSARTGNS